MPGFDRISELPESFLITQILLHLPTKDSVKTSVLSTRWNKLWLHVPGLDLNCNDFPFDDEQVFINFVDRFLQFNLESRLQKFKVNYSGVRDEIPRFCDRIGDAINRGIRVLDVKSYTFYRDVSDGLIYPCIAFMPLNLYTSKTLVSLKLSSSDLKLPGFVSMPCLKFMHLREILWDSGTMNLEKLISGCPVLEEWALLSYFHEELAVTRVRSRSLKRFSISFELGNFPYSIVPHTLEIDAPGLEYMSLKEDQFDRIVVKNLTSLFMVDLDIRFIVEFGRMFDPEDLSKRNEICDFLTGVSSIRHMTISYQTVKALDLYSKVGLIPKFNNLSRLQAVFLSSLLQFLPGFLENFPNLKHLILKIVYSNEVIQVYPNEEIEELKLVNVPRCFISTLEYVEIKGLYDWEEEGRKIASYFIENSAVLKNLILSFMGCPQHYTEPDIYAELNKLTKRSQRSIKIAWRPWYHEKQVSGWLQEYEGLTFATFRGAGHAVPCFKPSSSLAFFSAFLSGVPPPPSR